jgi:hypothetical protein
MMLGLDEGVRNQVKAEWSRLDVLLADALQAKGISPANDAALAMQTSHHMLHTSRELDQVPPPPLLPSPASSPLPPPVLLLRVTRDVPPAPPSSLRPRRHQQQPFPPQSGLL